VLPAVDPGPIFEAPRSKVLRQEVVHAIERALLNGTLAPGQRLLETDIARQMGISKGPVREALRQLEQLGLVVSYPQRGTFVAEITPTVASQAFSLRTVLESYAARLAIARLEDSDLLRMEEIIGQADALPPEEGRLLKRADLDLAFHDEIYRLSGHRLLQEAWGNLRAKIRVLLVATGVLGVADPQTGRPQAYSRGHAPILQALRARDAAAAEAAIARHLADGERLLLERLESGHDLAGPRRPVSQRSRIQEEGIP
jgi:DNA-binding GntR family transcriptional regulator